jgi:hypothetical protein
MVALTAVGPAGEAADCRCIQGAGECMAAGGFRPQRAADRGRRWEDALVKSKSRNLSWRLRARVSHHDRPAQTFHVWHDTVRRGLVFLVVGGWLISAVENTLTNALELPLAVAWVWVVFGEIATGSSLVGGIIVMAALPSTSGTGAARRWSRQQVDARATQRTSAASGSIMTVWRRDGVRAMATYAADIDSPAASAQGGGRGLVFCQSADGGIISSRPNAGTNPRRPVCLAENRAPAPRD